MQIQGVSLEKKQNHRVLGEQPSDRRNPICLRVLAGMIPTYENLVLSGWSTRIFKNQPQFLMSAL